MADESARSEVNKKDKPSKPEKNDTLQTIAIAIILAVILRSFLFEPFHIPSGSMKDTLLVGDYIFVSKYSYGYSRYSFPLGFLPIEGRFGSDDRPKRGDVAVFRKPGNTSINFIKRIVGLPGDEVQVRGGVLYINGKMAEQTPNGTFEDDEMPGNPRVLDRYTEQLPDGPSHDVLNESDNNMLDNTPVFKVPDGHYFCMGDNRDNSTDCRVIGPIPEQNLVGRADIIFFSVDPNKTDWWQVWKWPFAVRYERLLKGLK